MKILVISYESWRDTNNGGNVLSNIFCAFPEADFAQIYCSGELPQNFVCRKYYQISDSMLLRSLKGRRLEEKDYGVEAVDQSDVIENKIKNSIPGVFRNVSLLVREMFWRVFDWKTRELEDFIKDFKPDIIFAPCYSYSHVSMIALYAKRVAQCPMISYISDDNYTLKQLELSFAFLINRLITRKWIRRLFAECALIYTMTDMQKREYEAIFGRPMKILCKSASFDEYDKEIGSPIQFIYAGGLYLNRWKMLSRLADAIEKLNTVEIKAQLHIYSGSNLKLNQRKKLHDGRNSFLHNAISYGELMEHYRDADIAVHVESFDLKNRLLTRLSFSTKIIDCMNSGCAILAIGPNTQAGISYLKENDAAICINNIKEIDSVINKLMNNVELIKEFSEKARLLGKKNHMKANIEKQIKHDFYDVYNQHFQL